MEGQNNHGRFGMRGAARVDWATEFYSRQNEWCGVYSGDPGDSDHQAAADLTRLLGAGRKRILELGAGGGQRAAAAADAGYTVIAVEILPVLAANARRLAAMPRAGSLTVIEADFYEVELTDAFDAVCYWDGFGIGSDSEQWRLLRRIAGWLAPDGRALIDISTPWFWKAAAGQEMQRGAATRRYDYDVAASRMIDLWWPTGRPDDAVAQSIRCYAPADFRLLLCDTGLRLSAVEPGGAVNYANGHFTARAPLEQAMVYTAVLERDS